MEIPSGVRKGTWSKEEDDLLRACIQRYGEGKWRLVPQRAAISAGLNRCRKSCRLRWLNYLKPDIKRGNFTEDEADMIMRFHTLLGNRWSLISARFPGRTSNDVKNYWNSHIRKKLKQEETVKRHQVIRPRPVTLSTVTVPADLTAANICDHKSDDGGGRDNKPIIIATDDSDSKKSDESGEVAVIGAGSSAQESAEKAREWWESLLLDDEVIRKGNEEDSLWYLGGEEHEFLLAHQFWDDPTTSSVSLKFE